MASYVHQFPDNSIQIIPFSLSPLPYPLYTRLSIAEGIIINNVMVEGVATVVPKELLNRVQAYLPEEKVELVSRSFEYAFRCHTGQTRLSGEPFIEHPLQTALFLADLRLDAATIAAALLHDVMEDCGITFKEIQQSFSGEIAGLVDGVTKLTKLDLFSTSSTDGHPMISTGVPLHAESLRKMLVAMAEDIRVVLIKLADRLHNMRTLRALPASRRRAIAQETLEIYAPLAHRLGMWDMKWRLEDIAFRHLEPARYREISRILAATRKERETYVSRVSKTLNEALEAADVKAHVTGRPKNIYSTYRKIQYYSAQGKELGQIYDLYALRVLVKTTADCYNALGVAHNLWHPIPGQFDDYIARPKENLYQSLHTTVMCEGGKPLEVQIKTYEMHHVAEYGVAAHWRYKEGSPSDIKFEEKMNWLRQLLEWQREVSGAEEFMESVMTDIFQDQTFVYTPKGDIIELPAGATPIDFAYKIHTELGHRCIGAKISGKLVSLDYQLQSGDTVEVLTSKIDRGPSLDWLNRDRGFVRSASAREKIRQWFRKQERSANIQRGRELLHKELRRLNIAVEEAEVARMFKYDTLEEFLASLGSGSISVSQVVSSLAPPQEKPQQEIRITTPVTSPASGVRVLGVGDLLTRVGKCCDPIPGDEIIGFITRGRGVTVHKKNCPSLRNEDEKERLVNVEWGKTKDLYSVRVTIGAWDRVGLLRDITTLVSAEGVNIAAVITTENPEGNATIELTLHTTGIEQLSRLFSKLEGVRGVISATRSTTDASISSRN